MMAGKYDWRGNCRVCGHSKTSLYVEEDCERCLEVGKILNPAAMEWVQAVVQTAMEEHRDQFYHNHKPDY